MSELLKMSRCTADAECFHSVKPPFSFSNTPFLGNAVSCTLENGTIFRDWIGKDDMFSMWKYMMGFQILLTYNGITFDYPLWGGELLGPEDVEARTYWEKCFKGRTVDLCKDFHEALGVRVKLENVSIPTLGDHKEMSGGFAPDHWRNGAKMEVIEYCRGDDRRLDKLFVLACEGKPLKIQTPDGTVREFFCTPKLR